MKISFDYDSTLSTEKLRIPNIRFNSQQVLINGNF